jgi:hypothetical protein
VGAAATVNVQIAEIHRDVINQLSQLEALQFSVSPMGRDQGIVISQFFPLSNPAAQDK